MPGALSLRHVQQDLDAAVGGGKWIGGNLQFAVGQAGASTVSCSADTYAVNTTNEPTIPPTAATRTTLERLR